MQKEIEIRFKIENADAVRTALGVKGWQGTESEQLDRYYCARTYAEEKRAQECPFVVRIREGASRTLAYKAFTGNTGAWTELETEIGDTVATAAILEQLELREFLSIRKHRYSGKVGAIEANVDIVEGLGEFLELELMGDDEPAAREELLRFAADIGLGESQSITKGYVQLMQER